MYLAKTVGRVAGLSLATLLIASSWLLYVLNGSVRRDFGEARDSRVYPHLLQGSRPPILENTDLLDDFARAPAGDPTVTLVLVWSDQCRFCLKNLPLWESLIHTARPNRLWIVSLDGTERLQQILRSIQAAGVAYSLRTVKDRETFTLATGVRSTPTTIALDGDLRVRMVYTGVLTPAVYSNFQILLAANHDAGPEVTHSTKIEASR